MAKKFLKKFGVFSSEWYKIHKKQFIATKFLKNKNIKKLTFPEHEVPEKSTKIPFDT